MSRRVRNSTSSSKTKRSASNTSTRKPTAKVTNSSRNSSGLRFENLNSSDQRTLTDNMKVVNRLKNKSNNPEALEDAIKALAQASVQLEKVKAESGLTDAEISEYVEKMKVNYRLKDKASEAEIDVAEASEFFDSL